MNLLAKNQPEYQTILMTINDLTEKEKKVIEILRSREPYVNFRIEKRPLKENKNKGELTRIIIEESVLI